MKKNPTKAEREAFVEGYEEGIKLYSWDNDGRSVVGYPYSRPVKDAVTAMRKTLENWVKEGE